MTDKEFAARFEELLAHDPSFGLHDARVLRYGRHFRLPGSTKAIVGRNEEENLLLERAAQTDDLLLLPLNVPGPSVLCRGKEAEPEIRLAAALLTTYANKRGPRMDIEVRRGTDASTSHTLKAVTPLAKEVVAQWLIGAPGRQASKAQEN